MSLREKYIDGERAFRYYFTELGKERSTDLLLKLVPQRNPRTGERFTKDAFYKSMWRWACRPENREVSYRVFKRSNIGRDDKWTVERWDAELREKARWALTPNQYREWYQSNGHSE